MAPRSPASGAKTEALVIRADANLTIATGHVMRCLALAQAWQDAGGRVVFVVAECTPALEERLVDEGIEVSRIDVHPASIADAECAVDVARSCRAAWVVVDGYHFGADYQRALKRAGCSLLFLDDNGHATHYSADLVLNQNLHAHESLYCNRENYTQLLLGPRYVLLRREFRQQPRGRRVIPPVARKLLVTFGGSDPGNVTARVVEALKLVTIEHLEVTVVVGGSNPHMRDLERAACRLNHRIRFVRDANQMAELMAWADVAISGAGATCWEMCLLGLPAILIDLAPNQILNAQRLQQSGAAVHVGNCNNVGVEPIARQLELLLGSGEDRQRMSECGRKLVDGSGVLEVLHVLQASNAMGQKVGA